QKCVVIFNPLPGDLLQSKIGKSNGNVWLNPVTNGGGNCNRLFEKKPALAPALFIFAFKIK
ncbi:MAG TPA: hypothetical protein PLC89_17830, partial [Haliscomenobacter sp.]|uniref:hypothetical protein n=1 Tax=Haliscomenobacter sp. TaxID=2717303 RepID=UPI002CCE774F